MKEAKKVFCLNMKQSAFDRLSRLADRENQSITAVINRAIALYLIENEAN